MNKNNTGKKQSAIIVASEGDHVEIMKLLLHHDQTFVNKKNVIGQSALSVALKKCSNRPYRQNPFRIVKLLLRCPKAEIKMNTPTSLKLWIILTCDKQFKNQIPLAT